MKAAAYLHASGLRDLRRVRHRYPWFPSKWALAEARASLRPIYEEYVSTVSSAGMAASLETCCVLFAIVKGRSLGRSLDLGSGFSSYALRLAGIAQDGQVVSVDDDEEWLAATGTFLSQQGVNARDLVSWESFEPRPTFDLVFHDLAGGEKREAAMPTALASLSPNGVIIFDDMQHPGHRAAAKDAAAGHDMHLFSLRAVTLDEIERFAMLGVARGG